MLPTHDETTLLYFFINIYMCGIKFLQSVIIYYVRCIINYYCRVFSVKNMCYVQTYVAVKQHTT